MPGASHPSHREQNLFVEASALASAAGIDQRPSLDFLSTGYSRPSAFTLGHVEWGRSVLGAGISSWGRSRRFAPRLWDKGIGNADSSMSPTSRQTIELQGPSRVCRCRASSAASSRITRAGAFAVRQEMGSSLRRAIDSKGCRHTEGGARKCHLDFGFLVQARISIFAFPVWKKSVRCGSYHS